MKSIKHTLGEIDTRFKSRVTKAATRLRTEEDKQPRKFANKFHKALGRKPHITMQTRIWRLYISDPKTMDQIIVKIKELS
mgnify:CR=1 FL=1